MLLHKNNSFHSTARGSKYLSVAPAAFRLIASSICGKLYNYIAVHATIYLKITSLVDTSSEFLNVCCVCYMYVYLHLPLAHNGVINCAVNKILFYSILFYSILFYSSNLPSILESGPNLNFSFDNHFTGSQTQTVPVTC